MLCCVTGAILGATIVASQAGELINNFTVAVQSQGAIGAVELAKAIVPYPTHTEAIKYCCNQYNILVSACKVALQSQATQLQQLWLPPELTA